MPDQITETIRRFSSRRAKLSDSFLTDRLRGARAYDRIAGYFCSSIIETAGEALEAVEGNIRVVCNSGLRAEDVATARAAASALRQEWCSSKPEELVDNVGDKAKERFARLHRLLASAKLQVKVLPDEHFGLVHGKAGVITLQNGSQTSFLGSVNESKSGWSLNYELLWEDSSAEAVQWVQEEFDALWTHHAAVPLAEFIIEDIDRLSRREVITSVEEWKEKTQPELENPKAASVFVESPVYRKQAGLWAHQKFFVKLAYEAHLHSSGGARFVLADQVGLGKTVQLAMAAELMALTGTLPILVLAPKSLLWQWQDELLGLLDVPSAVWTGKNWVDENEIEYPQFGPDGIRKCPRRVGIVATSRAIAKCADAEVLQDLSFECVIVDEAHNARRQNLGDGRDDERPDPNNLLSYLYKISERTKSMMLATATPVQLRPVEAWDLLDVLSRGSEAVLGGMWSRWRRSDEALDLVMHEAPLPHEDTERWDWMRTPMPARTEGADYSILRKSLSMTDGQVTANGSDWNRLGPPDQARVRKVFPTFVSQHNPFITRIVRRSRKYLEETIDPETGEPYLKPIKVELFGEREEDSVNLPLYLKEAYELAEEFCQKLGERHKASGFLRTLLLRRVGSSIWAGRLTAEKMLRSWQNLDVVSETAEGNEEEIDALPEGSSRTLIPDEQELLERFVGALVANQEKDPKYAVVLDCLKSRGWLERGCIVFSQYYDSVSWLAEQLRIDFPNERIAIYAGSGRSGVWQNGEYRHIDREEIKSQVRTGDIRLLLGTDAASEGLNLQRLGTLINLDLPWNPTRLEQRKGRIQRIGQLADAVFIYNMRYRDSVEDRVHQILSSRLKDIHSLFGQVPDVLEDVWIDVALGQIESAKRVIDSVPKKHPFDIKYERIENVDWESCEEVLSDKAKRASLIRGW